MRFLAQLALYVGMSVLWIAVGFSVAYYEHYPSTRLLADAVILFFGAISAMITSKYLEFLSDVTRGLAEWMFFVCTLAGLGCIFYDMYLRHAA